MSLLTEAKLRLELKNFNGKTYEVAANVIVTPAAKQYLNDRKIKLVKQKKNVCSERSLVVNKAAIKEESKSNHWEFKGDITLKKQEFMTNLYADILVAKSHPIIALRGGIDSLQAKVLTLLSDCKRKNAVSVYGELVKILKYLRYLMQAEVKRLPFVIDTYMDMSSDEIRAMSHNPKKYFGFSHILPNEDMSETVLRLNELRAQSREVELMAINAFGRESGEFERLDIIEALNRLSSYIYIVMLRAYAEEV